MLNRKLLKSFYEFDMQNIEKFFSVVDKSIAEYLPKLHEHLGSLNITPNLYCLDWVLTLYSKSLPINIATRVWDVFLFEGEYFLVHVALGILTLLEKKLLRCIDFDDCVQILKRITDEDFDEAKFIETTRNIYFTKQKYRELQNN